MSLSTRTRFLFFVTLLIGVLMVYGFLSANKRSTQAEPGISRINSSSASLSKGVNTPTTEPATERHLPESARRNPQDFADEDKYRRLWVERGWDEEQLEIYKSYSMETLKALSEDGDVYATMALAEENDHWLFKTDLKRFQALSEQEQQQALLEVDQESLRLRRLAAAQGSTRAISSLFYEKGSLLHLIENEGFGRSADYYRQVYDYNDPAVPLEWELALDAAALAVVQGRRGEVTRAQVSLAALANDYGFEITLVDWPEILNRADTFYSEIARQRSSLGLNPFDNSVVRGYDGNYRGEPNEFYSNLSPDTLPELELR